MPSLKSEAAENFPPSTSFPFVSIKPQFEPASNVVCIAAKPSEKLKASDNPGGIRIILFESIYAQLPLRLSPMRNHNIHFNTIILRPKVKSITIFPSLSIYPQS